MTEVRLCAEPAIVAPGGWVITAWVQIRSDMAAFRTRPVIMTPPGRWMSRSSLASEMVSAGGQDGARVARPHLCAVILAAQWW
jgi:hypothetical protein